MGAVIGLLALVGIGVASYVIVTSINDSKSNDGNDESIVEVDKQPIIENEEILYTAPYAYYSSYNPYYYSSYPFIRRYGRHGRYQGGRHHGGNRRHHGIGRRPAGPRGRRGSR